MTIRQQGAGHPQHMTGTEVGGNTHNIGVLDSRVANLEYGFKEINATLGHLSSRLDERFNTIGNQIADGGKTQWPILISLFMAALSFTTALGYLTLQPIKDRQFEQADNLKEIRLNLVPRGELAEKWLANAHEFDNIRATSSERYKSILDQVDDVRKQYRDIYGVADVIRDLSNRIRGIEAKELKPDGASK